MKVNRKPETAAWHHGSAQEVDDVKIEVKPWVGKITIPFDATKDKRGERHTSMEIVLSEKEIEHLYSKLLDGRKNELKRLQNEVKKLCGICGIPNEAEIIEGSPAAPGIKPFGL